MTNYGAKSGSSQRKTEQSGRTRRTIGLVASSIALSAVLSQAGFAAPDKVAAVSESVSTGASGGAGGVVSGGVTEEVTLPDVDDLLNDTAGSATGVSNGAQDPMAEPAGSTPAQPATTALAAPSGSTPSAAPGSSPVTPHSATPKAVANPVPAANSLAGMTPINQVKLLYKQGKYRDALNVIARMKPTELTYYYTGLCYQGQGQLTKAAHAFAYTASVAKDPTIRYNAQVAQRAVASYARGRTYAGQGNMFASQSIRSAPSGGGGGGGGTVARS